MPELKPADARRFRPIVAKIRRNRVKGFEALRDQVLLDYELLTKTMPAYSALKIAIEADRHALFAQVAGAERGSADTEKQYTEFMRYLSGDVQITDGTPPPARSSPGRVQELIERGILLEPSRRRTDDEEEAPDG